MKKKNQRMRKINEEDGSKKKKNGNKANFKKMTHIH